MTPLVSEAQEWSLATLLAAEELAMFDVEFNGVNMKLPAGTLLTMVHCSHLIDKRLKFFVETNHGNWMLDRLGDGDIFLDVGAATGASLLPIAIKKPKARIIAFEPTIRASRLLRATLEANGLLIELLNAAAYESNGLFTFREFTYDPASVPFLTEASSIIREPIHDDRAVFNRVPAVTIDGLELKDQNIVMKIDVEGAEAEVLKGSHQTISNNRVLLSIDIHGDTEPYCRDILAPFGYQFTMQGHVLLCERG